MRHFQCVLLLAALNVSSSVCGDDIASDFRGQLIIADVARYDDLPTRMYLLPEFQEPAQSIVLSDDFVPLFVRVLNGDYENELHRDAARSLERVALEKLGDPELFRASLRHRLENTSDASVIDACVMALLAVDDSSAADLLATFCGSHNETLSIHIEPRLAKWKSTVLQEQWRQRIRHPLNYTRQMTALACRCLGEVGDKDSPDVLFRLALAEQTGMTVRQAAAGAAGRLDPDRAGTVAAELVSKDLRSRIIAATLLESAQSVQALDVISQLCEDSEDAVASLAWATLQKRKPEVLVEKLERGMVHRDANVRHSSISVMQQLPTKQRCEWLTVMLGDTHLYVRNNARAALHRVANEDAELRSGILDLAGGVLANKRAAWQQLEQSLLLLGQQSCSEFQAACIPLLSHERNEVMVTAGWLLHLMPKQQLADDVTKHAQFLWDYLNGDTLPSEELRCKGMARQLVFLFHYAASTKDENMKELCAAMFSKSVPAFPETRAAGLWALGIMNSGRSDEVLRARYVERIFDDNPFDPEREVVKAASAYSLGLMEMPNSMSDLRKANKMYGTYGVLAQCVEVAIRMLGEEPAKVVVPGPQGAGPWPIFPSAVK